MNPARTPAPGLVHRANRWYLARMVPRAWLAASLLAAGTACRARAPAPARPPLDRWSNATVELVTRYTFYPATPLFNALHLQPRRTVDMVLLHDTGHSTIPVLVSVHARWRSTPAPVPALFTTVFDADAGPVTREWEGAGFNTTGPYRALMLAPPGVTTGRTRTR